MSVGGETAGEEITGAKALRLICLRKAGGLHGWHKIKRDVTSEEVKKTSQSQTAKSCWPWPGLEFDFTCGGL